MSVKLITFKTNHTIMGDVFEETTLSLKVKKPTQVIMQPSKDGPMMGFAPFLQFAKEFETGMELKREDILCICEPITELENQYSQVFGVGIQIASVIPKV